MSEQTPIDIASEQQVIGCAVLEPARVLFAAAQHGVTTRSFYADIHRAAWAAITEQFIKQGFVDPLTVARVFKQSVDMDRIIDSVTTTAHAEYHIKRVKDFEQRRGLIDAMRKAAGQLCDLNTATTDAMNEYQASVTSSLSIPDLQIRKMSDFMTEKKAQWEKARETGYVGVPCHIRGINHALGGWRRGCLSLIGAYRGIGKSTFVRSDAKANAKAGRAVGLFTLEDPGDIATAAMVCDEANISSFDLDTGVAHAGNLIEACSTWERIGSLPLYIVSERCTINQIVSATALLKMRYNIEAIYVDHIQYIAPYQLPHMNRNDTVGSYSAELSNLAKRLNIAVIATSQFNRGAERDNRKPRLSDFRDSGNLEQDARQAVLIFWDDSKKSFVACVAKNNYGKSGVEVELERIQGKRFEEKGNEQAQQERIDLEDGNNA